jgi:flavin reductase (DIM6/NTAB) family NADH-FMN oxidoreductase RutF
VDIRELRGALGCFPTGVIVITASSDGTEHGMTANSFTSVSLAPPLILVCIDNNARMARLLERGMHFGLSILSADQEEVSRHFAGQRASAGEVQFAWRGGVPFISNAAASFLCRATDCHVTGDHTLYLAEIEHFERSGLAPLVFCAGRYAALGIHA